MTETEVNEAQLAAKRREELVQEILDWVTGLIQNHVSAPSARAFDGVTFLVRLDVSEADIEIRTWNTGSDSYRGSPEAFLASLNDKSDGGASMWIRQNLPTRPHILRSQPPTLIEDESPRTVVPFT